MGDRDKPRVSEELADAPTQRLYLASAFLLLQSFKLADLLLPTSQSELDYNWRLWKWILIDLCTLEVVRWLRIPRLRWGWKGLLIARAVLFFVDYGCFGRWQLAISIFLPTFFQSFFSTYRSTTETRVRLGSVLANDDSHLAGQVTVHILAVSTAQLNPASSCFCLSTTSSSNPILVPLVLNNTSPTRVTYTITSLFDPTNVQEITIPVSALVRPSSSEAKAAEPLDDLDEWAFGSPRPSGSALRHRLPAPSSSDESDPLELSASQSLYYLPISTTGIVRIKSLLDADGIPVRIRRLRTSSEIGDVRVLPCPRAGFATMQAVTHTCLTRSSVADSRTLGMQVTGYPPLSVRWHASGTKGDQLDGISNAGSAIGDIVHVPVNVSLALAGRQTFILDSVTDGCGNSVSFESDNRQALLPGTTSERAFVVHQPPEIAFSGSCSKGDDVRLLVGKKAPLELKLTAVEKASDRKDEDWTVGMRFSPESGSPGWERNVKMTKQVVRVEVEEPGIYEITTLKNRWCDGVILVPNVCTVVFQPAPTLSTSFSPLLDVCNSEIGALATILLHGTPPFTLTYILTQLSPIRGTYQRTERVAHSRSALRLEPGPGEWEYRFTKLQDAFYPHGVELPSDAQYIRKQTVQLIGGAEWRSASHGRVVHSCEGSHVAVEVVLSGLPPWDIEYSVTGSKVEVIRNIKSSPYSFDIIIPNPIAQRGGEFSLSLVSVTDGKGCRRPLAADDLTIDVRRTKPTARFHGSPGSRSLVIRENDSAKIPLRLTGEGPWTIAYQAPPPPSNPSARPSIHEFRATQPNVDVELSPAFPGTYTLISVRDRFCGGDVTETEWLIKTLPRPAFKFAADAGQLAKNGSLIRAPVCQNSADSVTVLLDGKPPWTAPYTITKSSHSSEKLQRTLQAIHPRAELILFTADPGHHSYQFTGIADSVYSRPETAGLVTPVGGRPGILRLEQEVFPLPEASFKQGPTADFCINDKLASRGPDDLVIELRGTPPFFVDLEVRTEGTRIADRFTLVDIPLHEWPVVVPLSLSMPALHTVYIRRVVDGRGCERVLEREEDSVRRTSISLGVAEIASITPVLPQQNHCVGEFLDFVVQGQPPFTVSYEFNGKAHVVSDVPSKFSRLATAPGEFRIRSVGHGQDQCRSSDVGLVKKIFALPSARVHHGEDTFVDMREGDQTEITFTFIGEPPFTFTYARRHPQDRTKDKTILETHTVAEVMEYSYSIFTSQEGTWSVTYIADKHCSFPFASSATARSLAIEGMS